jgi:hypothetical protein
MSGQFERLGELADESVASCRRHGRVWELAYILQLRGKVTNDIADSMEPSMNDLRESRALFERVGDIWGVAECLGGEAETTAGLGDWVRAAECCREAIALAIRLGSHQYVPQLNVRLGGALVNSGEAEEGERLLRSGIADAERFGAGGDGAGLYGRVLLTGLLGQRGDVAEAHALMDQVLTDMPASLPSFMSGLLLGMKGWLLGIEGDPAGGLAMIAEGIERLLDHPLASAIAPRLGVLLLPIAVATVARLPEAATGSNRDRFRRAAVLLGAQQRLRLFAIHPPQAAAVAEAVETLKQRLGEEAYEAAYAEGADAADLTIERAVDTMREMITLPGAAAAP